MILTLPYMVLPSGGLSRVSGGDPKDALLVTRIPSSLSRVSGGDPVLIRLNLEQSESFPRKRG